MHLVAGGFAAHDFEQAHDVRGAEEMLADHHLRALGRGGDFIDVEVRGVGGQDAGRLGDGVDFGEHLLLERHAFEHGLDDDVRLFETVVGELRRDERHALVHGRLREAALLHGARVVLADGGHAAIERLLAGLLDDHGDAGVGVGHGDAAAHGAGADDRRALDFATGVSLRRCRGSWRRRARRRRRGSAPWIGWSRGTRRKVRASRAQPSSKDSVVAASTASMAASGAVCPRLRLARLLAARGERWRGLRACEFLVRARESLGMGWPATSRANATAPASRSPSMTRSTMPELASASLRRDRFAEGAHLDGLGDARQARQALRSARAGNDAELHFGLATWAAGAITR